MTKIETKEVETPEQKASRVSAQINALLEAEGMKLTVIQNVNVQPK